MFQLEVIVDPVDKMVLESSLDNLMEEVGREKLCYVGPGEIIGEGL